MPQTKLYDMTGKAIGEYTLDDALFGLEPNKSVLHTVIKNYLANQRQGTQSTLTRAEVSGGGKKPWRQKGTGRARQGSTRSPQWTHGGVAFAPKPRDYSYRINRKVKKLAMLSALSAKAQAEEVFVIDSLKLDEIKTKNMAAFLKTMDLGKVLILTADPNENIVKSARNLPGVKATFAGQINVYDLLKYKALVVDTAALSRLEEVYKQ